MRFFCAPRRGGERRARGAADARRLCFSTPSIRVRLSLASFDDGLPIFHRFTSEFSFFVTKEKKALPPRGARSQKRTNNIKRERERRMMRARDRTARSYLSLRLRVRLLVYVYLAREFF